MTSLIVTLSLISALTATSSALSCTQCMSESSACSGSSITCPSGSLCGSSYTRKVMWGMFSEMLIRECMPSSLCGIIGTIGIVEGQIEGGSSCCSTDGCTPDLPTIPTRSPKLNGVTCPSCFSLYSTWCYTPDTVQCSGDENMCLFHTTEITGMLDSAIRGCATKSLCDIGSVSSNTYPLTTKATYTCSSGISTGTTLSCVQCMSESSTCSGDSVTCPSGSVCGSTYTRSLTGELKTESLNRGCTPSSECSFIGTTSTKDGQFEVGTSCCSTHGCTPDLPTFPTKSTNLNGVTCPSCVSSRARRCSISDTIQCTGDENMCLLQREKRGTVLQTIEGCATKSYCDLGNLKTLTIKAMISCTSGDF